MRKPAQVPASAPDSCTARSDSLPLVPSAAISSAAAKPETTSTPVRVVLDGTKTMTATAKPTNIARPPSSGVGRAWACRPPGSAIRPVRRESWIASGTTTKQTTNAASKGERPGTTRSRRVSRNVPLKKSDQVGSVKGIRERELSTQIEGALVDGVQNRGIVDSLDEVGEAVRDHYHLGLAHAARRHQRRADADAAGVELRRLVVRNRIAVERDAHGVGDVLHLFPGSLLRAKVDQHHVVVGAAAHQAKAAARQLRGKRFRVDDHLLRVDLEIRLERFAETHRLGGDRVHQRAALNAGKHRGVDRLLLL